ncbi:MAG: hypothetical protein R2873_02810 [Caldilineaceae bacterium]|nr:hypothetical protein [Caldilineaceae bacterium]
MSNPFVDKAKANMGAVERLLKGLPIIGGYVDKELRRDADYRLRQTIAEALTNEKQRIYALQQKLMRSGGLRYLDDVDAVIQKLQTLADRIATASYGYAGLLDAVRIKEEQLDALHRFDVALAQRTYEVAEGVDELERAIGKGNVGVDDAVAELSDKLIELNRLFDQRHRAVEDPDLLAGDAPEVSEDWIKAADQYGADAP